MSIATATLGALAVVGGTFGMNIPSGLEPTGELGESTVLFWQVTRQMWWLLCCCLITVLIHDCTLLHDCWYQSSLVPMCQLFQPNRTCLAAVHHSTSLVDSRHFTVWACRLSLQWSSVAPGHTFWPVGLPIAVSMPIVSTNKPPLCILSDACLRYNTDQSFCWVGWCPISFIFVTAVLVLVIMKSCHIAPALIITCNR